MYDNLKESLFGWALILVTAGGCFWALCKTDDFAKKRTQRRLNDERAKVIGIYDQRKNIENISYPKDFNGDNRLDYQVDFKDGRTRIYYNHGFETQNHKL